MIEIVTIANADPIVMPRHYSAQAVIFPVETSFQRIARRPGGLSRQQALTNAQKELRSVFIGSALSTSKTKYGE
jgi:hypothetical protein